MVTALALAFTYVYLKLPLPPEPASEQTTFLYDSAGNFVTGLHGEIDRTIIPLKEMPEHLKQAVIAAEDERFTRVGRFLATSKLEEIGKRDGHIRMADIWGVGAREEVD